MPVTIDVIKKEASPKIVHPISKDWHNAEGWNAIKQLNMGQGLIFTILSLSPAIYLVAKEQEYPAAAFTIGGVLTVTFAVAAMRSINSAIEISRFLRKEESKVE